MSNIAALIAELEAKGLEMNLEFLPKGTTPAFVAISVGRPDDPLTWLFDEHGTDVDAMVLRAREAVRRVPALVPA